MKNYDYIIVGGGPIGLNLAIKLAPRQSSILVLEKGDLFGGQLSVLYPEKPIEDLPGIPTIKAKDYISSLLNEIEKNQNITLQSETHVLNFISKKDGVTVETNKGTLYSKYLILSVGLGTYEHRKIGLNNEDNFVNILYSLRYPSLLKNQDVVILGGGDSAIDWSKELSSICKSVTLVHRRNEFRGDITPLLELKNVKILTPYNVIEMKAGAKENILSLVVIENVETKELKTLNLDTIIVNYGSIPVKQNNFDLEYAGNFVKVEDTFKTKHHNVFALGDMVIYEQKSRRILPGLLEIEALLNFLKD